MKIEIWSDFACPFCYIGKTRFEKALSKFQHKNEVEIEYKAYQLNPVAPKIMETSAVEAFSKGHHTTVEKAAEKFKMFEEAAKGVGLQYNYDIIQMTNTLDAHRVAKYAKTKNLEDEITARFMKAYFTDGLSLADHKTLLDLSKEIGLDENEVKEVLDSSQFEGTVREEINEGRSVGVRGVPFFVLNRKYGISGAQQEEYFLQSLEQLWEETKNEKSLKTVVHGETCSDEGCSI